MIVYRGRGILIAIIAFACLIAAEFYTRSRFHSDHYYQQHGWPKLAAFAVAALIIWWLSPQSAAPAQSPSAEAALMTPSLMNAPPAPERSPFRLDFFRPQDSLFFIPVRFWPLILCLLGVLFYFLPAE